MAPKKARYTKPGKPGRSIEEIMVQRRLDATDPTSWPSPQGGMSRSLTSLPTMRTGGYAGPGTNSIRNSEIEEVPQDFSANMEPMKEYCRTLLTQNSKLEAQLNGTVKVMQRELKKARDRAAEQAETQKMLWMKDMDKALADQQKMLEKRFELARDGNGSVGGEVTMSYSQKQKLIEANTPKPIMASESTMGKISSSMLELDMKVVHLKEIFRQGDPMEERRVSITKINACVRGYLQRKRYEAYTRGLREWKWLRARQIVWLLDMNMGLQAARDTGIQQLKVMHNFRSLYSIFIRWLHITRQALPVRKAMYNAAMAKADAKDRALVKVVWSAFKLVTVGGKSTKQANLQRREMITEIREELSAALVAKGEIGVVPEEDIERVLYRKVLLQFLHSKRMLMLKSVLINGFWKNVKMHRKNNQIALDHRLVVHAGKIFFAWSEWVFMVGAGLDRKRWSAPRAYEIHYNQKRVDNFARNRLKRFIFYPWKEFYTMQSLVRKMLQRQLARFVMKNFYAWREIARQLRKLRVQAVGEWRGYGRYITQTPFQAWAQFVKGVKNHNNEQQRIVNSYLRWKWRQRIVIIMKRWRHQALYGRIDGLYTRQMLIASLNEQKIMSQGLEKMMAAQTVEVDECRELTEREINKRKLLENRLKDSQTDCHKHKMYSHHAEQEMKRMEGIVEAVAILNPRQVEHLKRLQPQFQFKQRRVNIPKDEDEDEDLGGDDENEEEDEEDEDSEHDGKDVKKKKKSSLVDDDDGEDGLNDDVPSNVCSKCRQLLPGEQPDDIVSTPLPGDSSGASMHGGSPQSSPPHQITVHSPHGSASSGLGLTSPPRTAPDSSMVDTSSLKHPSMGDSMISNLNDFPVNNMNEHLNVINDEDMILLERVKWLINHFKKPEDTSACIPYVIPGQEIRTQQEEVVITKEENDTKKDDEDSDDEPQKRNRGNIEDEMEITKAKKKVVKPKIITKIDWTPGQLVIPERGPILPSVEKLTEEQIAILGPDGKMDTLLPGDPVHEPAGIDPEDTAARMLIGFLGFLQEGDVTTFAPADRRAWTEEVLGSVQYEKQQETLREEQAKERALELSGHHHHSMKQSRVMAASLAIGGAKDWRKALVELRTMFPGAGNYSGVGVELDSAESNVFLRIKEMRKTLDDVLLRQAGKFDQKIQRSRIKAGNREKLIIAAKLKAEAEEAERQRILAEELAEKERIKAEEEAKMAALRAAKAARKAAGEDSDSDSEEEEDEGFDLVNPYASLLGSELHNRQGEEEDANDDDDQEDY